MPQNALTQAATAKCHIRGSWTVYQEILHNCKRRLRLLISNWTERNAIPPEHCWGRHVSKRAIADRAETTRSEIVGIIKSDMKPHVYLFPITQLPPQTKPLKYQFLFGSFKCEFICVGLTDSEHQFFWCCLVKTHDNSSLFVLFE